MKTVGQSVRVSGVFPGGTAASDLEGSGASHKRAGSVPMSKTKRTAVISKALALSVLSLLLAPGCGKNTAPEPLPPEQVSSAVETAFNEASGEAKQSATTVINSLRAEDNVSAFFELQALASRADLTAAQRDAAARSMLSLNESLRDDAAQGDQRAEDALRTYRALK